MQHRLCNAFPACQPDQANHPEREVQFNHCTKEQSIAQCKEKQTIARQSGFNLGG
jgi:hypothetical protein